MKQVPESLLPGRHSLDRRELLQLGLIFGLSLSAPGLSAQSAAPLLTAEDMAVITGVSESIIPTTDTGGAIAAGVPDFVKMMVSSWFSAAEREHFVSGLREFTSIARQKYGKEFGKLTASEKDDYVGALLAAAETAQAPAISSRKPPAPFIVVMKRLTIFGYYTSEIGATIELHQQIATAQYEPAAVVKPGDRADSGIPSAMYPLGAV